MQLHITHPLPSKGSAYFHLTAHQPTLGNPRSATRYPTPTDTSTGVAT